MPVRLNTTYISGALADKLSCICDHPVSAIVAPIGYGKTRAALWWADECRNARPDSRILRQTVVTDSKADFWHGFCRNLRPWPELEKEMTALGFPAEVQTRQLMAELLGDALAGCGHDIYYIVDDVHALSGSALAELALFLSGQMPERLHIVLLSRNVIFDRAARLRLGALLWEIGADDLRLTAADIREYARRSGRSLSAADAEMLAGSTEGWFSMVYLCLRAFAQTGAWPEHTASIAPLIDEVLFRPLTARQREFLVRLGLPDSFSREAAEFLWQGGDAAALLAGLTEQNAFISCADGVYRYHNMLRSCAREKFARLPEGERHEAVTRLGQWYEKTGEYGLAAECYEKAGCWDDLLRAVGLDHGLSLGPERLPLVRRWMAKCPEEAQLRHPRALLVFLLQLFYGRDFAELRRYHALFARSMALCGDLTERERDELEGEALLRLSFLSFNDISAMSAYHRKIRALIPADRNPWTQGSPSVLMLYHSKSGCLDRENDEMRACMPVYTRVAGGHGSGAAALMQAETAFLRGDLADADILCRRAAAAARENGEYSILTAAAFLAARLTQYAGPGKDASAPLVRAADMLRGARQYRLLTTAELARGWLSALLGRAEQAPQWLTSDGASMAQVFPLIEPIFQVIAGRVLLETGQWARAAARTERLLDAADGAHFALCGMYAHLQNAAALFHLGKEADAKAALRAAWEIARPDGIVLPFAECDPCLDGLLGEILDAQTRGRVRALALRFRAGREGAEPVPLAGCGLTARELETARLAAARMSTAEIADALHISPGTVKNRLPVVYEKLGIDGGGRSKRTALSRLFEQAKS